VLVIGKTIVTGGDMGQDGTNEKEVTPARGDFDAFISYSSADRTTVQELKGLLVARKLTVWIDQEQLIPGRPFIPALENALQQTGSVVVVIGKSGIGPWQREEVQVALDNAVNLQRPVISVLLAGAPPPNRLDAFLKNRTWVDFQNGYSEEGIDRLVWGIKGQKPGDVRQSDDSQTRASTRWILVAGSGTRKVPGNIKAVSRRLGEALAETGFSLVTGGWNGVDAYVAEAFAERIRDRDQSLSGRLVQVMQKGKRPHFRAGRLDGGGSEEEAWKRSIERADAVVLVGGVGGTHQTGEFAKQIQKFVFPLADTRDSEGDHSDAYEFYFASLDNWDTNPLSQCLRNYDFLSLGNPASGVVLDLMQLLKRVLLAKQ